MDEDNAQENFKPQATPISRLNVSTEVVNH